MPLFTPAYIKTAADGRLRKKAEKAREKLAQCDLCPRNCGVNRLAGETGICKNGEKAKISGFNSHFGEEAPLVGKNGSGTIFFTHCNLMCNFCQNYDISHGGIGREVTDGQLADIMLSLQSEGCHNINFVTPSHVVPQILSSVEIAAEKDLTVPLVYNTSAYDNSDTLDLLDGIIDIYMPDFKFWDSRVAAMTCNAPDYPEIARKAVCQMHRQVGDLMIDSTGLARRGLLIRHLVMPNELAGTESIMAFIAQKLSSNTYVNIMPQYRPVHAVRHIDELAVPITREEFQTALLAALKAGLTRIEGLELQE